MSKLEEIRARWENATPGPWRWTQKNIAYQGEQWIYDDLVALERNVLDPIGLHGMEAAVTVEDEDAEAIAHAPEDIDYLLRIAEAAERVRKIDAQERSDPDLSTGSVGRAIDWANALDELRAALNHEPTQEEGG